jgi:predicted RNA-binding protein YlqC (UPF0109 family)
VSHLKDVVEVIGRALADEPQAVKVTETEHRGLTLIELFVAAGDAGKIIGRQGRTIAAIRTLLAATAERDGKKATLEIRDSPPRRA